MTTSRIDDVKEMKTNEFPIQSMAEIASQFASDDKIKNRITTFFTLISAPFQLEGEDTPEFKTLKPLLTYLGENKTIQYDDYHSAIKSFLLENKDALLSIQSSFFKNKEHRKQAWHAITELYRKIHLINLAEIHQMKNLENKKKLSELENKVTELKEEYASVKSDFHALKLPNVKDILEHKSWKSYLKDVFVEASDFFDQRYRSFKRVLATLPDGQVNLLLAEEERVVVERQKSEMESFQNCEESFLGPFAGGFKNELDKFSNIFIEINRLLAEVNICGTKSLTVEPIPISFLNAFAIKDSQTIGPDPYPQENFDSGILQQVSFFAPAVKKAWEALRTFSKEIYENWSDLRATGVFTGRQKDVTSQQERYKSLKENGELLKRNLELLRAEAEVAIKSFYQMVNSAVKATIEREWTLLITKHRERLQNALKRDGRNNPVKDNVPKISIAHLLSARPDVVMIETKTDMIKRVDSFLHTSTDLEANIRIVIADLDAKMGFASYKKLERIFLHVGKLKSRQYQADIGNGADVIIKSQNSLESTISILSSNKNTVQNVKVHAAALDKAIEEGRNFLRSRNGDVKEMLFNSLLNILSSCFKSQNLQYLNALVRVRSQSSVEGVQIPEGLKRIHNVLIAKNLAADKLDQIINIARAKNEEKGCCTFSLFRKTNTLALYQFISDLSPLVDKINKLNFYDLDITSRIEKFKEEVEVTLSLSKNKQPQLEIAEPISDRSSLSRNNSCS